LLPNGGKCNIWNVSKFYGVATSTLATRTSGEKSLHQPPSLRRPNLFDKEVLKEIVDHLLLMAD